MRRLLLLVLMCQVSEGELLLIEQRFGGMDCSSCATGLEKAFTRLRGVESAEVDAAAGVLRLRLHPRNTVQLSAVRDRIKAVGFTPDVALVEVSGLPFAESGRWFLALDGEARRRLLPLSISSTNLQERVMSGRSSVTLRGTIAAPTSPSDEPALAVKDLVK